MIKRYPVSSGFLALSMLVASYAAVRGPAGRAAEQLYYDRVERRLVQSGREFRPPEGCRWFGLYRPELPWDLRRLATTSSQIGADAHIVSIYQAWGAGREHEFRTEAMSNLLERGFLPLITWEPWLSDFGPRSVEEPVGSAARIAHGEFDDYVSAFARAATLVHRPFFLRPFHEVGNPWYAWSTEYNSPLDVAEAFRRVVQIFRREGASNVVFVWTPYTPKDRDAWPGDEWVDWVGLDIFNFGTLGQKSQWTSFEDILTWQSAGVPEHTKPVLLAEVGSSPLGGNPATWWRAAFASLTDRHREIKAVVVYDNPNYLALDAHVSVDLGISSRAEVLAALRETAPKALATCTGSPARTTPPSPN